MKRIITALAAVLLAGTMIFGLSACSIDLDNDGIADTEFNLDLEKIDLEKLESELTEKGGEVINAIIAFISDIGESISDIAKNNETPSEPSHKDNGPKGEQNIIIDIDELSPQDAEEEQNISDILEKIFLSSGMEEYSSEIKEILENDPEMIDEIMSLFSESFGGKASEK